MGLSSAFQDAFISYGRADSKDFATRLHAHLVDRGLQVWFDQNDIPLGVDFQNQIDDGIEKAHNFLFIIAPHSVNSPYCGKEIELALRLNKRIIPLLHVEQINRDTWQQRNPKGSDADWAAYQAKGLHSSFVNLHPAIGKINWVYFREGMEDFDQSLAGLLQVLDRHHDYVEQHTFFLAKALEWERQQKQSRYLLIGQDRQQGETWLKTRFKEEQPPCIPTDLHCEFITESLKNASNLMTDVFLSHAEEDDAVMEQVRRSLLREGFTVWTYKTDIQTGASFQEVIDRGIEEASNIVYLLSPAALQSEYCQREIDYALTLNKRIIPLLVQTVDPAQVPPTLRNLQYINLTDNLVATDYQKDESQLLRVLRQDATYYEEHKVLLAKALKWDRQHRNPSTLLRGYNLRHYEAWLKVAQQHQHGPTPLQEAFIAESLRQPPGISLDVFVSYSRADSDFARKLNDALQMQGKTTWFDQESIASGTDFQQEIYRGIENSDHFLFVISPNSIQSPYCADEVEYAQKLNKRIVTVLHRAVNPADLHPVLAKVQWIDFDPQKGDFPTHFKELIRTLDTDQEHLQTHTRLLVRAIEWENKGRIESLLLRGDVLTDAEKWLETCGNREPRPAELQREYISASRSVEDAHHQASQILKAAARKGQQRVMIGTGVMVLGILVASLAGAFAYRAGEQARAADTQKQAAEQQAVAAKDQASHAEQREQEAQQRLRQAAIAVKAAEQKKQAAEQQAQLAEQQLKTASVKTAEAEQQLRRAQSQIVLASTQLSQAKREKRSAEVAQQEAQAGTLLERAGADALEIFYTQELDALVMALTAGRQLQFLVQNNRPLAHYPAVSPLLGLQTILDDIREQTRFLIAPRETSQLLGHFRLSSDGKTILTSLGKTVQIRDRSGKKLGEIPAQDTSIVDVSFSPNGRQIVTVNRFSDGNETHPSRPDVVKLWDATGKLVRELPETRGRGITSVRFSPDGQRILTAQGNAIAGLWDTRGRQLLTLKTRDDGSFSDESIAEFSPDGKTILTASGDVVRLWDLSGNQRLEIKAKEWVRNASFKPDSKSFLLVLKDSTVQIFDPSGKQKTQLRGYRDGFGDGFGALRIRPGAHFSPDGESVVVVAGDRTVRIWTPASGEIVELTGHRGRVVDAYFSADGESVITAAQDGIARIWDFADRASTVQFRWMEFAMAVNPKVAPDLPEIEFSPDGQHAFIPGSAEVRSAEGRKFSLFRDLLNANGGFSNGIFAGSFSADGKRIVGAVTDHTIRIWDMTGKRLVLLRSPQQRIKSPILSVNLSPNGRYIVTTADNKTHIWDVSDRLIAELQSDGKPMTRASFSPDSQRIVTIAGSTATLWDISGRRLTELKQHQGDVTSASFSPDGQWIVTTSTDETAKLWDQSGRLIAHLKGHQDKVTTASFSPDGQRIVTASLDESLRVWDLQGRTVADYTNLSQAVISARFISNREVIAATVDGDVHRVQVESLEQLLTRACRWLNHYLKVGPDLSEGDRRLCDANPAPVAKTAH